MSSRVRRRVIPGAVFLIVVAFLVYRGRGAVPARDDMSAHELSLVADRCGEAEAIDRWLLQQSWFHDPSFTRLAGAFGQTSFTFFGEEPSSRQIEGAFCISGTELVVRYYRRGFLPVRVSFSELSIAFGARLAPLGEDVYSVRELTNDKMILAFASDGREHVFYRKN